MCKRLPFFHHDTAAVRAEKLGFSLEARAVFDDVVDYLWEAGGTGTLALDKLPRILGIQTRKWKRL